MERVGEDAGFVPSVYNPFRPTGGEDWQHKHSGLCRLLHLLCRLSFLLLLILPNPVELGASRTTNKEVNSEEIPVLRDDDQRISGPNHPCGCQHRRLGDAEFVRWSSHIGQAGHNQTPFKHRGPEEHSLWSCCVVVEGPQLRRQGALDPVQNPVIARPQRRHGDGCGAACALGRSGASLAAADPLAGKRTTAVARAGGGARLGWLSTTHPPGAAL